MIRVPLVAQIVKNLPATWETWVRYLGWKIPWRKAWQPTLVFLPKWSRKKWWPTEAWRGWLCQPPRSLLGNHRARPASVLGEKRFGLLRSCCLPCTCHLTHNLEHCRWLYKEPLELGNQLMPHCTFSWPNMSSVTNRWARWSLGCWQSLFISVYILLIFLILTCNLTLKKIRRYRWARREWKSLDDHPCWLFAVCPLRLFYAYLLFFIVLKVGLFFLGYFIISHST